MSWGSWECVNQVILCLFADVPGSRKGAAWPSQGNVIVSLACAARVTMKWTCFYVNSCVESTFPNIPRVLGSRPPAQQPIFILFLFPLSGWFCLVVSDPESPVHVQKDEPQERCPHYILRLEINPQNSWFFVESQQAFLGVLCCRRLKRKKWYKTSTAGFIHEWNTHLP